MPRPEAVPPVRLLLRHQRVGVAELPEDPEARVVEPRERGEEAVALRRRQRLGVLADPHHRRDLGEHRRRGAEAHLEHRVAVRRAGRPEPPGQEERRRRSVRRQLQRQRRRRRGGRGRPEPVPALRARTGAQPHPDRRRGAVGVRHAEGRRRRRPREVPGRRGGPPTERQLHPRRHRQSLRFENVRLSSLRPPRRPVQTPASDPRSAPPGADGADPGAGEIPAAAADHGVELLAQEVPRDGGAVAG